LKYAYEAAQTGEAANLFIFDETLSMLIDRGLSMGMDVRPHIKTGLLKIEEIDPAEISPGELMSRIRTAVEQRDARVIVLDSVNGYLNAMPEERFLSLQLHELLTYLNHKGVMTLMVLAQQGFMGAMQSPVDLTYLADAVILLRYFESDGEVKQAISVVKKRSGRHERTLREYSLDERGVHVGEPLRGFHGILTGNPTIREAKLNR
jgi:circadian clock protein KaiC